MSESLGHETVGERSEGRRWLDMVGRGHLENDPTNIVDAYGQPLPVGRFQESCDSHVRPLFLGLEAARVELGEAHPEYAELVADTQALVDGYLLRFGVDPAKFQPPAAA